MVRNRLRRVLTAICDELRRAFRPEYTPRQIAGSVSLGVFITMLPTIGVGLLVFILLAAISEWINKVALFASVAVVNPVVKWGVYATSLALGVFLLGPMADSSGVTISAKTGQGLLYRSLLGNLILVIAATVLAYVIALRLARRHQATLDELVEVMVEEVIQGS